MRLSKRKQLLLLLPTLTALAVAAGFALYSPNSAQAQVGIGNKITPASTAWCGVTDGNGTVLLTLSDDMRFVDRMEIRQGAPKALQISTVEGNYRGVSRAQIQQDQFIFRKDIEEEECRTVRGRSGSARCTRAPCNPSRCERPPCNVSRRVCENVQVNTMTLRGKLHSPESIRGTFTAITEDSTRRNNRVRVDRVIGNFVAWPVGFAPCP